MSESREEWKARLGIGQRCSAFRHVDSGPGSTRTADVMRDEAPGKSGERTEHWSGRVDATVTAPTVIQNPNLKWRADG